MGAARKDITIAKDVSFYYAYVVQNEDGSPFDLTGYTAAAKVRAKPESPTALLTFTCSITVPSSGGPVVIKATRADIAPLQLGTFHWDNILTHATSPDIKTLKGKAIVEATASR